MFHRFFEPHPALKEMVNNIMINHIRFDPLQLRPSIPFPPLPEHCLFFYPYDCMEVKHVSKKETEKQAAIIIVGPQTERLNITMGTHHLVIKVGFQPGGLYRLLGIPMCELLRTEAFDATELLGNEIKTVNEQLREVNGYPEMKNIVDSYLLTKLKSLKQPLPIDAVLPMLIQKGGLTNMDELASMACLSNRQFERVFKERIGLSPKFFSRLVRFANAWVLKEASPAISWTKIAHECGYYDQMHMIRDFKAFTATSPSVIEASLQRVPFRLHNKVFY